MYFQVCEMVLVTPFKRLGAYTMYMVHSSCADHLLLCSSIFVTALRIGKYLNPLISS